MSRWSGPLWPPLLDHLLRAEEILRRRRVWVGGVIAAMIGAIAFADDRLWPGISLAFGYAVPIVLGAYAFGLRVGVELSILCVILRRVCAGRAYGPWWLYAGSALMLTEYLLLAVGVGLLGRAVRRLERHTRVLGNLNERSRDLTTILDPEAILRQSVEAAVPLTGADGGFAVTAVDGRWRTDVVFTRDRWQTQSVVWWPVAAGPWEARGSAGDAHVDRSIPCDATLWAFGGRVQLAVPIPEGNAPLERALVVFRSAPRVFTPPTLEVLELLALHVAAALKTAALYGVAVRASEEKARMLACVVHDLRGPLHGLLWDMDTVRARNGEPCRELERMQDNARIALDLVTTLQEFADIETRPVAVRPGLVPLGRVFEDLQAMVESLIAGRPIAFRIHVAPGAETLVTDPDQLYRILANLLSNAAKFTERGTIEISAERSGTEVAISVRDTGVGIARAELAKIFEPFYQGETRPFTARPGMGLGLTIAHELAQRLGGRLDVESDRGSGTVFRLRLPVSGPTSLAGVAADGPGAVRPPAVGGAVMLLVGDDQRCRAETPAGGVLTSPAR